MAESVPPGMLKMATCSISNRSDVQNHFILNYDGTPMHVFQAPMIRLLAKGLGVTFNIVIPEDNKFGKLEPDGKSTGLKGMLERGETDLSISGFTMNQKMLEAFPFTYPLLVTDSTFMTNKLEPYPKSFAVVDVFSFEVWLSIGLCLMLMSLFLYFLLKRRVKFSKILLESAGCLLEQAFSFDAKQRNTALLLLYWFIGAAILSASYKAVILSILTAPNMVGIRDFSALSKAAKTNSIKCFAVGQSDLKTHWFNKCVDKSNVVGFEAFRTYPGKKVYFAERIELDTELNRRLYYISGDSSGLSFIGIPHSKKFCCPKKLESVVHRIVAAGLYKKILKDHDFLGYLRLSKEMDIPDEKARISPLKMKDLTGAFIVLFVGHLCSFFVLIAEILHKKWH